MAQITFSNVSKQFGDTRVIAALDLDIPDREFMVLVGPSGCGKSTALRMIAGLEDISAGELRIGGRTVNDVQPKDRDVAMVFQNYALYPHMSVYDNIAFGLKVRDVPPAEVRSRVDDVAATLGLTPLLARKPKALSGGQRQRVALGRAIVRNPSVFLFDEPLSNLDAELRVQMRAELARLQTRLQTTTVYVTHDQVEAMTLGQRIAVLAPLGATRTSNLQQVGSPLEIYDRPANVFVATFMGSPRMNVFPVTVSSDATMLEAAGFRVPAPAGIPLGAYAGRTVLIGIRPEHIGDRIDSRQPHAATVRGTVEIVETVGHEVIVHVRVAGTLVIARLAPRSSPAFGAELQLVVDGSSIHLFDPESERRLGATAAPTA
jgi:multiple sugar transport system ATP-binding protein